MDPDSAVESGMTFELTAVLLSCIGPLGSGLRSCKNCAADLSILHSNLSTKGSLGNLRNEKPYQLVQEASP